jgi:type II secretory pathway component PulF
MNPEIIFAPVLGLIQDANFLQDFLDVLGKVLAASLVLVLEAGCVAGVVFLIHLCFTLPMRRTERARLFLNLLEGALKRGQSVEAMMLSVSQSRDTMVGMRFHLVAAYLEGGLGFSEALDQVPRFLPPQIAAMLRAGAKLGDLKKVLPACHEILRDRPAAVRSAAHYLMVVVVLFSPVFIFVMIMTMTFVVPRFKEVAGGMGIQLWPLTIFVFTLADSGVLVGLEIFITLVLALITLMYIGGPGFVRWFQFRSLPVVDWIAWRVPWKQKRLQRTFSAMLAVMLDSGVPEAEAVRLAGDCTANEICRRRSRRVVAALEQGGNLDAAVRAFDHSGGFHWRLRNATHARDGFLSALRGWHETLDAKAFQQEETTAHLLTSGLVILNGTLVALIATAMFGILMSVLNHMVSAQ